MIKQYALLFVFLLSISLDLFAISFSKDQSLVIVSHDVKHDLSLPLSTLARTENIKIQQRKPMPFYLPPPIKIQNSPNKKINFQSSTEKNLAPVRLGVTQFAGIGIGLGSFHPNTYPPDTNGAVGTTQYVQVTNNTFFAVFSKSGTVLLGPIMVSTLWKNFGGSCENAPLGDPIVKFDQLTSRWVIAYLVGNGSPYPFRECVAVSQTADAQGSFYRYEFDMSEINNPKMLNDYPKLAVWPNGYYVTANMFDDSKSPSVWMGSKMCALQKSAMLVGKSAMMQCKQLPPVNTTILPADLIGKTLPPSSMPEFLLGIRDSTSLNLWKFSVNWTTPANTTLSSTQIKVEAFKPGCAVQCVPQPASTVKLNALGDRLMYPLTYRQISSTTGSLLANHSVSINSVLGIRWYQILVLSTTPFTPTIKQQGTFSPDSNYRFMGSIGMDKLGNIALGYSKANGTTLYPSIAFGIHNNTDSPNMMSEKVGYNGAASQSGSGWGDYSSMTLDPTDNCTFWYTNEYLQNPGTYNWSSKIFHFKFANCV